MGRCEHGRRDLCPDCIEKALGPACSPQESALRELAAKQALASMGQAPPPSPCPACSRAEELAGAVEAFLAVHDMHATGSYGDVEDDLRDALESYREAAPRRKT